MWWFQVLGPIKITEHLKTSIKLGAPQLYKNGFLSMFAPRLYALHEMQILPAKFAGSRSTFSLFVEDLAGFHLDFSKGRSVCPAHARAHTN